jgi:hypothetical protein
MLATISHVKSVTIADSTNTSLVRPSDWNSAHNVTLSLQDADVSKYCQQNQVVFGGYDEGLYWSKSQTSILTSTSSTSRPWVGMPATLGMSKAISGFLITAGLAGVSSTASRTAAGTMSMGIYSSSAGTLSSVWTSSIAFSWSVSSQSQTFTLGGGASSHTYSSVTTGSTRMFRVSIPMTLTLLTGTYVFGCMDQMTASGCSLVVGNLLDPLSAAAASCLVIGSSLTQAMSNPVGILTASITAVAAAAFPLSLTGHVTTQSASRYPYAVVC